MQVSTTDLRAKEHILVKICNERQLLRTSPGHLQVITSIPVEKPISKATCRSDSPVPMSLHGSGYFLYSPLQYIKHKWDFCFLKPVLCRTPITCSILVQVVRKLVSPVPIVNVMGMCDSEFENINWLFWSSPKGLSHIWTRLSIERLGDKLSVWIYYSVLLCTVSRGLHS